MKKYSEDKTVQRLIEKYPDAITHFYNSLELDFVTTVDRFAKRIMENTNEMDRLHIFKKHIKTEDECARHIATYLFDLNEACQNFLEDHLYMNNGEVYAWDDEDEYEEEDRDDYEF